MPSESYWLQAEADARAVALRTSGDAWTKLADLYRENAEAERKRSDLQPVQS